MWRGSKTVETSLLFSDSRFTNKARSELEPQGLCLERYRYPPGSPSGIAESLPVKASCIFNIFGSPKELRVLQDPRSARYMKQKADLPGTVMTVGLPLCDL